MSAIRQKVKLHRELRARWTGDHPTPGQYLCAGVRARGGYRILGVRETKSTSHNLVLQVERVELVELVDAGHNGAVIHQWTWDARSKAGSAGRHR